MNDLPDKPKARREYALIQLLPNVLTVMAICAGLTAIRFTIQENYTVAVQLILLAAVLDGIDGKLARALGCDSSMGAELDSLADFLNFGVAPPLVLYFWALQDASSIGWIFVLIYTICCVVRLARFNIGAKSTENPNDPSVFVGVPAPGGALLVLLPMFLAFAFHIDVQEGKIAPDLIICIYMGLIGYLMIGTLPTPSLKRVKVSRENVKFYLVGFVLVVAAFMTYEWLALLVLSMAYACVIFWSVLALFRRKT